MKIEKLIWKLYFIVFGFLTLAGMISLIFDETATYKFYHILITFSPIYILHYAAAVLKTTIWVLCLIPIFCFAFDKKASIPNTFLKYVLYIRIPFDVLGSFYEYLFIKSAFHLVAGYGYSCLGAILLPLIPSYIAHYLFLKDQAKY